MDILLTAVSGLCSVGAFLAYLRSTIQADKAWDTRNQCELVASKLREERDRVTVLERDVDALRRELRKLSGKFYASEREREDTHDDERAAGFYTRTGIPAHVLPPEIQGEFCENWEAAKVEGPRSPAAACTCVFCMTQRAARSAEKAAILAARQQPKGNGSE